MNKIKAALFDIDGTILDTRELIFCAFEHVIKQFNLPKTNREKLTTLIGKTIEDCYNTINGSPLESDKLKKLYEVHAEFQLNNLHLSKKFPNTFETLSKIKKSGLKISAVSSRGKKTVPITLEQAGIKHFFDLIITMDDVVNQKPNPEGLIKSLEYFQISTEEAIMIGDSNEDVQAGKNAGIKTIGAIYGFHGENIKKSNPDYVISDIKDVIQYILD